MYLRGELGIHPDDVVRRRPEPSPFKDLARVQIAPTEALIITTREQAFESARWGLCPRFFERVDQYGRPLINARGETAATKPSFRGAVAARRFCLVWCTGWFEWQKAPGGKAAHHIQLPGRAPLALGGVWEDWPGPAGLIRTAAIVTVPASADLDHIHDRMPMALHPSAYSRWLEGEEAPGSPPEGIFEAYPVTSKIGRPDYQERDALKSLR